MAIQPGRTARALAEDLLGKGAATSRLQFALTLLLDRGVVRREGEGGRQDPYRYYPVGPGADQVAP